MLNASEAPPSSSAADAAAAALFTCSNCGMEEHRLLHHVRLRGSFRRLCTTCVLRLHPQSFCPSCFTVYNAEENAPTAVVTCNKCHSISHTECVGVSPNPANPYVCPLCVSPNSVIFSPRKVNDLARENPDLHAIAVVDGNGEFRVIDRDNARVLLAAAKISAVSMSKAAAAARLEAERRAKEAANTRKRARAALEHVAYLVAKDKMKKKERLAVGSSGGGAVRIPGRNVNTNNTPAPPLMRAPAPAPEVGVSQSGSILTALNAVELRDGEKKQLSGSAGAGPVPMEVEASKTKNNSNAGAGDVAQNNKDESGKK